MAVSQAAEFAQQGVGDLERNHPKDLGAGDGQRRPPLEQEPVVQQPSVLDHLAGVVGHQVAVAAGHGARPAQRTARLLIEEPGQEQPIAPEAERGYQLGQPRVLSERLGRLAKQVEFDIDRAQTAQ